MVGGNGEEPGETHNRPHVLRAYLLGIFNFFVINCIGVLKSYSRIFLVWRPTEKKVAMRRWPTTTPSLLTHPLN